MALESLVQRPLLGAADGQTVEFERPPVSRLAIVAFVFGILSSLATLGYALLPVAIVAIALSLLVYWQLSRDSSHCGKTLAMLGLGLGVLFVTWALTTNYLRDQYMYQAGPQIAEHFLKTLSKNQRYEAFELTRSESERQIAGTSLETFYESTADQPTRDAFRDFLNQEIPKLILSRGESSRWRLVRGLGVNLIGKGKNEVSLEMLDDSKQPEARVRILLDRDTSGVNPAATKAPTATWYVRLLTK